jgi:hypothetical protein
VKFGGGKNITAYVEINGNENTLDRIAPSFYIAQCRLRIIDCIVTGNPGLFVSTNPGYGEACIHL